MSNTTALLRDIHDRAIAGAMAILPAHLDTPHARVMLLAIGLQESGFRHRRQLVERRDPLTRQIILSPTGPAKSFWGAEKGGGMVHGVRLHNATSSLAAKLYVHRGVAPVDEDIWNAIQFDDVLAAALARLLLLTDTRKIPVTAGAAWAMYTWNWRPGKPRPDTFPDFFAAAREFMGAA